MHSLWDVVRSIIEAEERALMEKTKKIEKIELPKMNVSKTVNIPERTLEDTFELVVDGAGWLETLVVKTTDKNWALTIRTEQGNQYFNETFDSLEAISLGNPQLDVQDRMQFEGFYFVNVKNVRFLERLEVYLVPKPTTHVKNIFALYYVLR